MRTLLSILFLIAFNINAQDWQIFKFGETTDVAGEVVDITSGASDLNQNFHVVNNSSSSYKIRIVRKKIIELDGTMDYLCWGGQCDLKENVSPVDPYTSDGTETMAVGDTAILYTYHVTNDTAGCARYRYYLMDTTSGAFLDSVDVQFCSTVSVEENQLSIPNAYPNPVVDVVAIDLSGFTFNKGKIEIYNAFGAMVFESNNLNSGINHFDFSELSGGLYFYRVILDAKESEILKLNKL